MCGEVCPYLRTEEVISRKFLMSLFSSYSEIHRLLSMYEVRSTDRYYVLLSTLYMIATLHPAI